jgi:RNA polymerase sigma factor (sigma-70 family)
VDEHQDAMYEARRADLDAQFQALPPVGSPGYWQRIEEQDATQQRLPLEVLARCFRERIGSGVVGDANRIFGVIMRRIQAKVRPWAQQIARMARSGMTDQRREELEQECYMKLWEELGGNSRTFLLENFASGFTRLRQHVSHSYMQQESEWQRSDEVQPNRVPRAQVDSLDMALPSTEELPLSDLIGDPHAQDPFEQAELSDLMDQVRGLPPQERLILLHSLTGERQEGTAARLGVTARTIRNRLKRILEELRRRYEGGEGDDHV